MSNEPTSWRRELRKGLEASRIGDFVRAARYFERAHRFAPAQPEACLALGRERWRQGDLATAESLIRQAHSAAPDLVSARLTLVRLLALEHRDFAQAHELLDALPSDDPTTILVRAEVFLEEEDCERAAELAEPLRSSSDAMARSGARIVLARVHNARGLALAQARNYESAVFSFKTACDLDPTWATPISNLGAAFEALGRLPRALAAYEQATVLDASQATAWHNLARLRHRLGDGGATESYQRAHAADPGDPDIAVACARHLLAQDPQSARSVLRAHAVHRGDRAATWLELGQRLAVHHELDLAEECLRHAYERAGTADARRRLASLLARKGQWPHAIQLALVDEPPPS